MVLLDRNPSAFELFAARGVLTKQFRGSFVVGDGTDVDTLRRAGAENADAFVALTDGDNRNIMASQIAGHVFSVPQVICRIYDPIRAEAYEKLGLQTYCPTLEGTARILSTLSAEAEARV